MGAIDLVVQVEAPTSVACGLQRIGRAGHQVGDVSRGVIFPKFRHDLWSAAVVAERMHAGQIEETRVPRNPLDVLAQQIVAMVAVDDWPVDELERVVRRAAPFADLTRPALEGGARHAGRAATRATSSPSCGPGWCGTGWPARSRARPGRPDARRHERRDDPGPGPLRRRSRPETRGAAARVGELDEEMVYESPGRRVFLLGATSWRIEDITATPSWSPRRPASRASCRSGTATRWAGPPSSAPRSAGPAASWPRPTRSRRPPRCARPALTSWPRATCCATWPTSGRPPAPCPMTGPWWWSGSGTSSVTGASSCTVPTAPGCTGRGRWPSRPGSASVTAASTCRPCTPTTGSSSGPRTADEPPPSGIALIDPDEVERHRHRGGRRLSPVRRPVPGNAPPAPCSCRGASPGRGPRCGSSVSGRPSCWRWRASTRRSRSCWRRTARCQQDVFDVPALVSLLRDIAGRQVRMIEVETSTPSPFSRSLLFRYVARVHVRGRRAAGRAAGPGPDPGLGACWPSCSARPTCASCSIRPSSRKPSVSCSAWRWTAGAATSRDWPTCCARSAPCRPTR